LLKTDACVSSKQQLAMGNYNSDSYIFFSPAAHLTHCANFLVFFRLQVSFNLEYIYVLMLVHMSHIISFSGRKKEVF